MDNLNGPTGLLVAVSSLMFFCFSFLLLLLLVVVFYFFINSVKNKNLDFITLIELIKCNSDN